MDCVHHPGVDAPYQCFRCREYICVDCEAKVEGRSYCRSCLANIYQRLAQQYESETRNVNLGLAGLSGLGAAVITAVLFSQAAVWFSLPLPFWPALLGGAVGWGIVSGTGGKRGERLQKMALVISLLGVVAGFFLIAFRTNAYVQLLQERNLDPVGFTAVSGTLSTFPTYLSKQVGLLGWFFALVGLGWSWYIPHERSVPD